MFKLYLHLHFLFNLNLFWYCNYYCYNLSSFSSKTSKMFDCCLYLTLLLRCYFVAFACSSLHHYLVYNCSLFLKLDYFFCLRSFQNVEMSFVCFIYLSFIFHFSWWFECFKFDLCLSVQIIMYSSVVYYWCF